MKCYHQIQINFQKLLIIKLIKTFGDFNKFKEEIIQKGLACFGSGWVWVIFENNTLKIIATPNQDSPYMYNMNPILGIDLWEHAYYLKYKNLKKDYLENIFNCIDWEIINTRLENIK